MPISNVFNMDCMKGMKEFPDKFFDLAVVDPPYGQESDATKTYTSNLINKASMRKVYKQFGNIKPEEEYFNELERVSRTQIIWGGNFFGLEGGYICWNKFGTAFGEAELAWVSSIKSVRVFEYIWNGMIQEDMKNKEHRIHPTQKPVQLYKYCLTNYAKQGNKILDTHMGSQSSRIAAFNMGFDYWGYELDPEYFEAGNKRFKEQTAQIQIF